MTIWMENFKSPSDIIEQFEAPADALDGAEVLLAWYGDGSYSGSAFVLYRKDGKLFEVNGSHCSCYGLEDQWEPEETSPEALLKRDIGRGWYDGDDECQKNLQEIARGLTSTVSDSSHD